MPIKNLRGRPGISDRSRQAQSSPGGCGGRNGAVIGAILELIAEERPYIAREMNRNRSGCDQRLTQCRMTRARAWPTHPCLQTDLPAETFVSAT